MNVLISGGAGFIGSNLAIKLIEKNYNVIVFDSLSKQIHGENPENSILYNSIKNKTTFILGDVRKKSDWEKVIYDVDIIIHFAVETGTGQSMYEIERYTDVNVNGTAVMLDLLTKNKHKVKKIIIASSRAIYGEGKYKCSSHGYVYPIDRKDEDLKIGDFNVKCPICNDNVELCATDEESKIHPTSIYGITKQIQEQMVLVCCKSIGIPAVVFRYQNVYGPGQSLKNPYTGILSIFSTNFRNNNDVNIFEDGKESRDFVYIDDVVDATILGIEKDEANNEAFNVGTGVATDVITVAEYLKKAYDAKGKIIISGNYRLGDIRDNYADLYKINLKLGYIPKYSFQEGIIKFAEWVKKQPLEKDRYKESIDEMKAKGLFK